MRNCSLLLDTFRFCTVYFLMLPKLRSNGEDKLGAPDTPAHAINVGL